MVAAVQVAGAGHTAQASSRAGMMLSDVGKEWSSARCVRGARLASGDHTIGARGHIARLRAVNSSRMASDWLSRGEKRLKAEQSSQKET